MKTELQDLIFTERYRPDCLDDIIFANKDTIDNYLKNPKLIPSFIFESKSPGTGKSSLAKIIVNSLGCDSKKINASDDRGIDAIREQVILFAQALSTNGLKRCIILEESDSLTTIAQNALRDTMETFSDNVFFIFTCNDISKIIAPIQSRCVTINFQSPNIYQVKIYISKIWGENKIGGDIRSMVSASQEISMGKPWNLKHVKFEEFLESIKQKDFNKIKAEVFDGFDIKKFVKWFFNYIFDNYTTIGFDKATKIVNLLADIEKHSNLNVNLEIIFIANIMEISKVL